MPYISDAEYDALTPEEREAFDKECEAEAKSEIDAENAWLRVAEYDPRMDDPREW